MLLLLIRERGWNIFVHPVSPVLNETRYVHAILFSYTKTRVIVRKFNALLKFKVLEASAELAKSGVTEKLHWLDFFEKLLEPALPAAGGTAEVLQPCYSLDGTHLAPTYVGKLLQPAVSECLTHST